MDDIWIISWFNHTAFDANPIWKSLIFEFRTRYFNKKNQFEQQQLQQKQHLQNMRHDVDLFPQMFDLYCILFVSTLNLDP